MALIANVRNIRMNHERLRAEWCTDSRVRLQRDAVTVEICDEPGVAYRLHPTTGGIESVAENAETTNADAHNETKKHRDTRQRATTRHTQRQQK